MRLARWQRLVVTGSGAGMQRTPQGSEFVRVCETGPPMSATVESRVHKIAQWNSVVRAVVMNGANDTDESKRAGVTGLWTKCRFLKIVILACDRIDEKRPI